VVNIRQISVGCWRTRGRPEIIATSFLCQFANFISPYSVLSYWILNTEKVSWWYRNKTNSRYDGCNGSANIRLGRFDRIHRNAGRFCSRRCLSVLCVQEEGGRCRRVSCRWSKDVYISDKHVADSKVKIYSFFIKFQFNFCRKGIEKTR